ncbi:unnamed protein product [Menidia menidia]|uniref:(Atlantic silverside) hypothetical protein n=1 Tax=Menidia menidia TaxID=238744 RepID=A0A8S4B6D1_9TELE|nr:unnamed protein product [Menidia menidia]
MAVSSPLPDGHRQVVLHGECPKVLRSHLEAVKTIRCCFACTEYSHRVRGQAHCTMQRVPKHTPALLFSPVCSNAQSKPQKPGTSFTERQYQAGEAFYISMMETNTKAEAEAQEPDNTLVESPEVAEFELTSDRLEQLMKSMEVLLSDVEQLRSSCSHQATELTRAAVDLKQQQDDLKESYAELSREMQEIVDSVEDLFSTKSAFEAKEKQAQKLNRQL